MEAREAVFARGFGLVRIGSEQFGTVRIRAKAPKGTGKGIFMRSEALSPATTGIKPV
jgi:hypothetical protein